MLQYTLYIVNWIAYVVFTSEIPLFDRDYGNISYVAYSVI